MIKSGWKIRRAKSEIIQLDGGGAIGVIKVPAFYSDYTAQQAGKQDYRSTARDVRRLLEELQQSDLDGLVIDLRGNGGGSLAEALELTGTVHSNRPHHPDPRLLRQHRDQRRPLPGYWLRRPAGGTGQPQQRLGFRDLCRRHPGLPARHYYRRANFRKRHGTEYYRPEPVHRNADRRPWAPEGNGGAVLPR